MSDERKCLESDEQKYNVLHCNICAHKMLWLTRASVKHSDSQNRGLPDASIVDGRNLDAEYLVTQHSRVAQDGHRE